MSDKLTPMALLDGLVDAARLALPIIVACATAGLIAGVITLTGVGLRLAGELVNLAGERLLATASVIGVKISVPVLEAVTAGELSADALRASLERLDAEPDSPDRHEGRGAAPARPDQQVLHPDVLDQGAGPPRIRQLRVDPGRPGRGSGRRPLPPLAEVSDVAQPRIADQASLAKLRIGRRAVERRPCKPENGHAARATTRTRRIVASLNG